MTERTAKDLAQVARTVDRLPSIAKLALAEGPWPEPHCGVCRSLEKIPFALMLIDPALHSDIIWLLDWHDEPMRQGGRREVGWAYTRGQGAECYARCMAIYAAAKASAEVPT